VSLHEWLLGVLCDPVDRGPLFYVEDEYVLVNPRTKQLYDVRENIAVLVPGDARSASDEEVAALLAREGRWTAGA